MVQVCAHLWAMQQLLFWRAFPCSQDAQLLVHKHMPRAGFLYEYGRPAGAARARVNRDSRNELMELHATQKVCHRRAASSEPGGTPGFSLRVAAPGVLEATRNARPAALIGVAAKKLMTPALE
jgi:hypothetical protein